MRGIAVALLAVLLAACGDDDAVPADAGTDARHDAGRDSGPPPPMCAPACEGRQLCCPVATGAECIDTQSDPEHCGVCDVRCDEGRGTHCAFGWCVCGTAEMGCLGRMNSTCCPPRLDGGIPYCANLYTNTEDCGSCNNRCDLRVADRCNGGVCLCGLGRTGCTGAPDSVCCLDSTEIGSCVDTTTDNRNCGRCGGDCTGLERCVAGVCVSRDAGA
jgi:hypothetical protein